MPKKFIPIILILTLVFTAYVFTPLLVQAASTSNNDPRVDVIIQFNKTPGRSEQALVKGLGGEVSHSFHLVPAIAAKIPEKAQQALLNNPMVTAVEPDGQVYAVDIELDNSWGVKHINSGPVHDLGNKGSGAKIAIIDSGVNGAHPDLNGNYKGGYDFVQNDTDPSDVYGHGTHVAGSACAKDNNNGTTNIGVVGVSPDCALYSVRVLDDEGYGSWSNIIAGVQWAVDNGMDIANLSLGNTQDPGTTVKLAFDNAESAGLFIVAAAGNSGRQNARGNTVIYPAKYGSVVAVAATDINDERPYWSSYGEEVELAAPGVSVFSTWNDSTSYANPQPVCGNDTNGQWGCYKFGSGTSMSSPHVAGVAALLISAGITDANGNGRINDDIRSVLNRTAKDIGQNGKDELYGYGLVDAYAAVLDLEPGSINISPVAVAGPDQTLTDTDGNDIESVTLDGTGSYDSDGTITKYEWELNGIVISTEATFSYNFPIGTHTVTLTVTDDKGATGSDEVVITVNGTSTSDIYLTALGYKYRGLQKVDLQWVGATTNIDVYRNGIFITTTNNDEFHTDDLNTRGGGEYVYRICESANTSVCSNEATVIFN